MSYKNLLNSNLSRTFKLIKDLSTDMILTRKPNVSFNFGTSTITSTGESTITTKGIQIKLSKPSANTNGIEAEVMLNTKDVGDINQFETITYDSSTWKIGPRLNNDGYITVLKVYKEV